MKILVLNGSPRPSGNTAKMVAAFKEGAESHGHEVNVVDVCKKNIKGCLGCEYCHGRGNGKCVQEDDMQEVYSLLKEAEMPVSTTYRLQLLQYFSNIIIDTDGFRSYFIRGIGFIQVDTGICRVRPLVNHSPEAEFYYAGRIHSCSQFKK